MISGQGAESEYRTERHHAQYLSPVQQRGQTTSRIRLHRRQHMSGDTQRHLDPRVSEPGVNHVGRHPRRESGFSLDEPSTAARQTRTRAEVDGALG